MDAHTFPHCLWQKGRPILEGEPYASSDIGESWNGMHERIMGINARIMITQLDDNV
jgi:hypothetical protein